MIRWYRRWLLERRIKKARKLLILIDRGVKRVGMPRYARRQMWRDFMKSASGHEQILELLEVK